jgi:anti-sigma factor RsiW
MAEHKRDDEELMHRYLLGELPEEEQEKLEARYFADDELFELLLVVEDELLDRYARGDLSEHERRRLERHFLQSQARRKRLMFTEAFMKHLGGLSAEVRHERASWWQQLKSLLRLDHS